MPRPSIRGCWDFPWADRSPTIGRDVTRDGRLPMSGWVLDADQPPTIEISIGRAIVAAITPTQYREDIAVIFASSVPAASGLTGWVASIDVSALPPGLHDVSVTARAGRTTLPLGTRAVDVPSMGTPDDDIWRTDAIQLLRTPDTRQPVTVADGAVATAGGEQRYPLERHQVFLTSKPGAWLTQPTSVWGFSRFARELMHTGQLRILAIGAGMARTVPGLIQLDICDYPNIDVVCDAPRLPFVDEAFDAVVCENVIEHVPDPFALVAEIERVIKPGGHLGLNGTNLHFTHGFPSHYFNPTEFGMRHLLEHHTRFEGEYEFTNVAHSLRTVLGYYLDALDPDARRRVERMRVSDIMAAISTGDAKAVAPLERVSDIARRALSTNIYFSGRKRP